MDFKTIVLLLVGVFFVVVFGLWWLDEAAKAKWPKVRAKVVKVEMELSKGRHTSVYMPRLHLSYEIDGLPYASLLAGTSGVSIESMVWKKLEKRGIREGVEIEVHHDPKDPSKLWLKGF